MKQKEFRAKIIHYFKIIFLIVILYIASVNAYNLLYIPEGGKPIKISEDSPSQGRLRYFEKVEVLEPSSSLSAKEEIQVEPTTTTYPQVTTIPPITPQATIPPSTSPPQKQPPISTSEVLQFSYKLELFELKDGSIIELHISQSQSEVFTIYKQNRRIYVEEGDASNEDIELWITRSAFKELETTDDISYTIKRLGGEGKVAAIQKVSKWTLLRRGYMNLAKRLEIM